MAEIKLKIASVVIGSSEGGGGGVAPYYADLPDKPSINGETLSGNMSSEDLGLASSGQAVPSGGTTGQVLAKKSNADNDVQWVNQESGGTEVEANPSGEATTPLNKIKIGDTNYNIPQTDTSTFATKTALQEGLDGKQNTISNLSTIESGAAAGATAVQPSALSTVATSGDYDDLIDKPTIPDVSTNINSDAESNTKAASPKAVKTYVDNGLENKQNNISASNPINSDFVNDSLSVTKKFVTPTEKGLINTAVQNITRRGSTLTKKDGVVDIPEEIEEVVATPVAAGGSPTVDLTNGTLTLGIPRGADAVNPFKGWFTTDNIPTTGQEGDYCNVSNTSVTPHTVSIYRWSTVQNAFVDTGEVPDTATIETFASSETLHQVAIDDSHLVNPVNTSDSTKPVLAQAEDVIKLKAKLEGVTMEETKVALVENTNWFANYKVNELGKIVIASGDPANAIFITQVTGYKRVRVLGFQTIYDSTAIGYGFSASPIDTSAMTDLQLDISSPFITNADSGGLHEYLLDIPEGMNYLVFTIVRYDGLIPIEQFYCYLQSGENVSEIVDKRTTDYEALDGTPFNDILVDKNAGEIISYPQGLLTLYKVKQGKTIKINVSVSSERNITISIPNEKPDIGVTANVLYFKRGTDCEFVYTANSDCYIAVSLYIFNITYNIECKQLKYFSDIAKEVNSITNEIGFNFAYNENIIDSVFECIERPLIIGGISGNWTNDGNGSHIIIDATGIDSITIDTASRGTNIAFLKSYNTPVAGERPDYADGTSVITFSGVRRFVVPLDAKFIFLLTSYNGYGLQGRFNSIIVNGRVNSKQASKKGAPSGILYVELDVNVNALANGINTSVVSDSDSTTKSSFGVRFPSNYTPEGTPTRVLAMFHGYSGYVSGNSETNVGSVLGYSNSDWINFQNILVNAGFAVMDINGYGIYNANNNYNYHWGCPGAVMTVKKAFEYLKANYNVCNEMLVFGFSMGGCIAWAYTMNFPEDVIAVAMHEPTTPSNNDEQNEQAVIYPTIAQAYGYNSWSDVEADDYGNFVGYSLPLSLQRYDNGVANFKGIVGFDISHELPTGTELIGSFPRPVRIWQGTKVEPGAEGEIVSVALNENIVNALRHAGCNASIRYCPNLGHSDLNTTQYVIDETLYFLNRYK